MLKQQVVKLVLIVIDNEVLGFDAFEDGNDAGLEVVEEERLFPTREVLSKHLYNLYHTPLYSKLYLNQNFFRDNGMSSNPSEVNSSIELKTR